MYFYWKRLCILIVVYVFLLLVNVFLLLVYVFLLLVYVFLLLVYVFLDAATLIEVLVCFFLSCKANARV